MNKETKIWLSILALLVFLVVALVIKKDFSPEPEIIKLNSVSALTAYSDNVFNHIPCSDPVSNRLETSQNVDFVIDEYGYIGFRGVSAEVVNDTKMCYVSSYVVHTECVLITEWYPDGHEKSGTYHYLYWIDPNNLFVQRMSCNYLLFPELCPKCDEGECLGTDGYVWVHNSNEDNPNYELYRALRYEPCTPVITSAATTKYVRIDDGFSVSWIINPDYEEEVILE